MRANSRSAAIAAAVLLSGLSASASTQTQAFNVDCGVGQKISTALALGDWRKPLVVTIRGTCTENVVIARDDVTLQAQPGVPATVTSAGNPNTITIRAARVVLDGLTVNGGFNGIAVTGTLDALVRNCVVQNAGGYGISLTNAGAGVQNSTIQLHGSHGVFLRRGIIRLANNQIRNNGGAGVYAELFSAISAESNTITANQAQGIFLLGGSQASLTGNAITTNVSNGIEVDRGSQVSLNSGNTIAGNEYGIYVNFAQASIFGANISNNRAHGVHLNAARADIAGTAITGNAGRGINGFTGSTVYIEGGTVSNNASQGIQLSLNGTAYIGSGTVIQGNGASGIRLRFASKLQLAGNPLVDATGNNGFGLECLDAESSYVGSLTPSSTISCTGY